MSVVSSGVWNEWLLLYHTGSQDDLCQSCRPGSETNGYYCIILGARTIRVSRVFRGLKRMVITVSYWEPGRFVSVVSSGV